MTSSLRERSRQQRRAAIERAALELFAERGYDETTVADIGERAEVAPRTVSGYFPSKLHLALSYMTTAATRLEQRLHDRPHAQPVVEAIVAWLNHEFDAHGDLLDLSAAMFRTNPQIRGAETPELSAAKAAVTAALAADLGRATDDIVVGIAGGAFEGVIDVLIQLGRTQIETLDAFTPAIRMLDAVMHAASRT